MPNKRDEVSSDGERCVPSIENPVPTRIPVSYC